jgi:hypothetical protein
LEVRNTTYITGEVFFPIHRQGVIDNRSGFSGTITLTGGVLLTILASFSGSITLTRRSFLPSTAGGALLILVAGFQALLMIILAGFSITITLTGGGVFDPITKKGAIDNSSRFSGTINDNNSGFFPALFH